MVRNGWIHWWHPDKNWVTLFKDDGRSKCMKMLPADQAALYGIEDDTTPPNPIPKPDAVAPSGNRDVVEAVVGITTNPAGDEAATINAIVAAMERDTANMRCMAIEALAAIRDGRVPTLHMHPASADGADSADVLTMLAERTFECAALRARCEAAERERDSRSIECGIECSNIAADREHVRRERDDAIAANAAEEKEHEALRVKLHDMLRMDSEDDDIPKAVSVLIANLEESCKREEAAIAAKEKAIQCHGDVPCGSCVSCLHGRLSLALSESSRLRDMAKRGPMRARLLAMSDERDALQARVGELERVIMAHKDQARTEAAIFAAERYAAQAEAARLKDQLHDAGKRGDAYMDGMDQARDEAKRLRCDLERFEDATDTIARLAGLLRECLDFACPNGESPTSDLACRIDSALTEVEGK
jgi:hypothetical protein